MKRYDDRTPSGASSDHAGVRPMSHTSFTVNSGAGRSPGEPVEHAPVQERVMSVKEGNKEGSDLSQFAFLRQEWPTVLDAAGKAESAVYADPRASCFYARRALELAVRGFTNTTPD